MGALVLKFFFFVGAKIKKTKKKKKLCYKLDNYDDEKNYEKTLGWTQDELMLALLSFNKYGDDLDLCSQIISKKLSFIFWFF